MNYNVENCFQEIKGSYQEYIFGSVDEYIKAIPEPGLNAERTKELRKFVKERDNQGKTANPVLLKQMNDKTR